MEADAPKRANEVKRARGWSGQRDGAAGRTMVRLLRRLAQITQLQTKIFINFQQQINNKK
jgi:hypothetical protein